MWGIISETLADTCKTLLHCIGWDQQSFYDEFSDSIPPPIYLPEDLPFKSAKDLSVNIPPNDIGKVDVYIDDNIVIIPDIGDNHIRAIRAISLAIHSISRPVDTSDNELYLFAIHVTSSYFVCTV